MERYLHRPVLVVELLEQLAPKRGGTYVDANLGGGGHAEAVLDRIDGDGRLIGIDLDPSALTAASERLQRFSGFRATQGNFADVARLLDEAGVDRVDGVYFDLGVSSPQLDRAERGFSIKGNGPLDMRFGPQQSTTAAELVNEADEGELARIIHEYGEERWAKAIAKRIVRERPIRDTAHLSQVVSSAIPRKFHPPRINAATRTFQALRIAVNDELNSLQHALDDAIECLKPGGRLCCISYHSLEDRIVKQTLQRHAGQRQEKPKGLPRGFPLPEPVASVRLLTRQAISPTVQEIETNPRARSARLRAAEKI